MIGTVCALVLSYVFATAALHKWRDMDEFAMVLDNYGVLPGSWVGIASRLIGGAEVSVAVALLAPGLAVYGGVAAAAMLFTYAGGIALNLARGRRSMDCGCGGSGQRQLLSEWLLVRNCLLIVLAIVASIEGAAQLAWYEWAIVLPAAISGCLIYNIGNQLLVNRDLLANLRMRNG